MYQQIIGTRWQHNWRLWLGWMSVTLVGGIVAAFVTYPVAEILFFQIPDEITAILASRLIPGALLGAILGVLQSLVFRHSSQPVLWWIVLSSLGAMSSSLIGESAGGMLSHWIEGFILEPDPTYAGVMTIPARFIPLLQFTQALGEGLVGGAIIGGFQVLSLRPVFRRTYWWVIGSALGWMVYFTLNWFVNLLNTNDTPMLIKVGFSTILPWMLYSTITGYVLFWVLRPRLQANDTRGEA